MSLSTWLRCPNCGSEAVDYRLGTMPYLECRDCKNIDIP